LETSETQNTHKSAARGMHIGTI